jgi:hypothetical protein
MRKNIFGKEKADAILKIAKQMGGLTTIMGYNPIFDEQGRNVNPNANTTTVDDVSYDGMKYSVQYNCYGFSIYNNEGSLLYKEDTTPDYIKEYKEKKYGIKPKPEFILFNEFEYNKEENSFEHPEYGTRYNTDVWEALEEWLKNNLLGFNPEIETLYEYGEFAPNDAYLKSTKINLNQKLCEGAIYKIREFVHREYNLKKDLINDLVVNI